MIIRDMRKSKGIPFKDIKDYSYFHREGDKEDDYHDLVILQKYPVFVMGKSQMLEVNAVNLNRNFEKLDNNDMVVSVEIEISVVE